MPKITFFNLPEDKKHKLILAAKKEFSRVPLYDASISHIVKSAGIPRGSFYQYFEDKEDAFFFLLNDFVVNINSNFVFLLKKYEGDLFETMIEFYQLIIEEEENVQFLRNAFLNMTYKIETTFSNIFRNHDSNNNFKVITPLINTSLLNISNDRELFHLMQIISTVTFRNVVEKYAKDLSKQEALGNYIIEINLLKNGLTCNK
ncbi:TetR/AcrR family transcriptional regulator [Neobacillus soli]|uniref:TetR/AcrR family transcriptional regulator n=1 Tax=Neobacillus soli TaxID=220688 RepID=UPI0008244461|nr:TetR/AcrR family transcriptional regulator [Neobacillus soli]